MIGSIMQGAAAITDSITNFNNMAYGIFNTERNHAFQREQYEYQKRLQQKIFQREDTAVQRRAADLKAAGFNPLLAAGGAASSGQAVNTSFSNVPAPNFKSNNAELVAQLLAMKKMNTDISFTKAQQELINNQSDQIAKNNELLGMQIQWYKDHPGYAPGVESGLHTGKGISSTLSEASNRIMNRLNPSGAPQIARPNFNNIVKYHMNNGVPAREAVRRAEKMLANYK